MAITLHSLYQRAKHHQQLIRGLEERVARLEKKQQQRRSQFSQRYFGVETELLTPRTTENDNDNDIREKVAQLLKDGVGVECEATSYSSDLYSIWQIKADSSLKGSEIHFDPCHSFEVVSPKLSGQQGLRELRQVLRIIQDEFQPFVNKKCGLHVHVDASGILLEGLRTICVNWLHFEAAIESFFPASRRDCQNQYVNANRRMIRGRTLEDKIKALQDCMTKQALREAFCGGKNRYTNLNLRNILPNGTNSLEFRIHPGSFDFEEISNWIKFCISFVEKSVNRPPVPLLNIDDDRASNSELKNCKALFLFLNDPILQSYYEEKVKEHEIPLPLKPLFIYKEE